MINKGILAIGIISLLLGSCVDHEIIPAPTPEVDKYSYFIGTVNGATFEFTENVLGYVNTSVKSQIILPPPSFSSAVYFSQMSSPQAGPSIKIGLGSIVWDASLNASPGVAAFNVFFTDNDLPLYSNSGTAGFVATFRDGTGREWESNEASTNIQTVEFVNITQESDETGDYSSFTCNFECTAYSLNPDSLALLPPVLHLDSINIQNGMYTGWFQR